MANYWGGDPGVGPARAPAADPSSIPDYLVIILRAAPPLGTGSLWDELVTGYADILTVIVPVFSLRVDGVQISDPLSWERTFVEVEEAVRGHALSRAARVVVLLGASGAVVIPAWQGGHAVFRPLRS